MNTDRFPRPIPILSMAALTGWLVLFMAFGGAVLAATLPVVTNLENKYDMKGLAKPSGIAIDQARERIYVTDPIVQKIYVFNLKGRKVGEFGTLHVPNGVAVGPEGKLYVVGQSNGNYTVYVLDGATGANYGTLNTVSGLEEPSNITVDFNGNIYVLDKSNSIKVYDPTGALKTTMGPYVFYMDNETLTDSSSGTKATYARTKHSMISPIGIAIDEEQHELYVQFRELVEREDSVAVSTCSSYLESSTGKYLTLVGDYYKILAIGLLDGAVNQAKPMPLRGYLTEAASCTTVTSSGIAINPTGLATDNKGRLYAADAYWGVRVFDTSNGSSLDKAQFGIIRVNTSNNKINNGPFDYNIVTETIGGVQYRVITVDLVANGYPAMSDGNYNVNILNPSKSDGTELDSSQIIVTNKGASSFTLKVPVSFVIGTIPWSHGHLATITPALSLAYDKRDANTGRLLVTAPGMDLVKIFGIDGGGNPGNNLPVAPGLISPADRSVVATDAPALEIVASFDADGDPITYIYEITSPEGAITGSSPDTTYSVSSSLKENTSYSWKVRSNDGDGDSAWSSTNQFCVNVKNDSPSTPVILSPLNGATASPFGTSLIWDPSSDPDCTLDSISYVVEVSGGPDFSELLAAGKSVVAGVSVRIGDLSGAGLLKNGFTYYWRVKAVDNNGGESAYSVGSFTFKTTSVRFESELSGAKVYIDGNYGYFGRLLGTAPWMEEGVTPGSHFVTFVKIGFEPHHKIINVKDPLIDDSLLTVTARINDWVKTSKIKSSVAKAELLNLNGGNAAPFVVDYNNDGLKDIVAGGRINIYNEVGEVVEVVDGRVYLYLAEYQEQVDGSMKVVLPTKGIAIQAAGSDINIGSRAVPFVVDFNNDSKKDLLIGSHEGQIYLYLNTGEDAAPVFTSAVTIKDGSGSDIKIANSAPTVVDYNNDDKKDIIVGGAGGTLRLYLNIGSDSSPEFVASVLIKADNAELSLGKDNFGNDVNSKVFMTDWNSDGRKDMIVGGATLNLYLNVGTDEAPIFLSIQGLKQWITEKKSERGNREFISFLGYKDDIGDLTGGSGEASPFVVSWDDTSDRYIIVGNLGGGVVPFITQ